MYKIERICEEDLFKLKELYTVVVKKDIKIEFLKKKFNTQAFGKSFIGFLALDSLTNEPAAYYGVFPIMVLHEGKRVLTAQSGDTMTHPKHQGKGLFTKLAQMTYELAHSEGIELVWGMPNKNSYPGFVKKLNWIDNGNLLKFKLKLGTIPIAKIIQKLNLPFFSSIYTNCCKKVLSNYKNPFTKLESAKNTCILKDEAFFYYKNYYLNRFVFSNDENIIWAKIDGALLIGDIFCNSENDFRIILRQLKMKCRYLGISEILFYCNSNYSNYNWIKALDGIIVEDSLPFCYLQGWNDPLAKSLSICLADFDTF